MSHRPSPGGMLKSFRPIDASRMALPAFRPNQVAVRHRIRGLASRLLFIGGMRATTLDAFLRDLELLISAHEPSLSTIRAAFAGIAALAWIWFL